MRLRPFNFKNLPPLLKPPKPQYSSSTATPRHFSTEPQNPPPPTPPLQFSEDHKHTIPQIVSLLQTTSPDEWPTNTHLHHLLLSASPHSLLKITRQLGSLQKSLQFFDYLKNDYPSDSSPTSPPAPLGISPLSFAFQAVLEHAVREEDPKSPAKLLELFNFSKEQNVPLSLNSATLLIKLFGRAKMCDESVTVFSELRPDLRNIHVVNLLLDSLLKSGRIDDALKMVDKMLKSQLNVQPNDTTMDTVLSAFFTRNWSGRNVREEEIIGIVSGFGEHGIFPDSVWLTQLVSKFCRSGKCDKAWELLHMVMRLGGELNAAPYNALLTGLGKENDFRRMNLLMIEMKEKDISPDVKTFGILINHLCKCHRVDEALETFKKMRGGNEGDEVCVVPDVVVCNTIIHGLCKVGRQEEGLKFMGNMKLEHGCMPNTVTYNSIIDGFCKAGEIERAFELFDRMKKDGVEPNVITLNTLVDGMCKCERVGSALEFFDKMQEKGLKGNSTTYSILITAFCRSNNIDKAMALFDQMSQSGCPSDAIVYYSLISGLTQAGRLDDASSFVSKLKKAGFCLDIITYNVLIGGYCRKNKFEQAYEIFKDMEHAGVKPDRVTYNTLVSYFCDKGDFETAHRLLKKMMQYRFLPNVVTYGALIHAYCKAGHLDEAMKIFKEMNSSLKVSANNVIYNTLIDALCKSDKVDVALSLMDDMKEKGVRANTTTYNAILKGLRERNWLEKAFKLMDEMTEKACNPDYVTMEILLEWLSAVGQTEKLRRFVQGYEVSASVP
ncbi:uncharacterized protein [Coffea arabica]|uniref:Pentatricopeptide repeat-containing protein At3g61520, mitochondrial-like n=1 Tax=Coffea arabica TaxID=13443 RepID=A0ABM4WZV7_COFAR